MKNSKLLLLIIFLNSAAFVLAQDINKINIKYASYVVNESGALLGYYGEQNRVELKSLDLVPQHCINCLISTEDRDFWSHDGVSVRALTRAAYETIFKGRTQGGSTLTMQLARNLFLSFEKTLQRKVKEIKIALDLEKRYSKKEILLLYLNFVYFGNGAHGLWAASEEYFSKEPKYLSIDESAVIVSLLKSPEQYNPYKFPDKALNRRNEVMYNMVENGKLDKAAYYKLKNKPLGLKPRLRIAGHYVEYVRREAAALLSSKGKTLSGGGVKITCTLDTCLQLAAEYALNAQYKNFPKSMKNVQTGLVSVDNSNGYIRAMIGGNENSEKRGLNRAVQIRRQAGSAFKPILYASLLEKGYSLASPLKNLTFIVNEGTPYEWKPENYDASQSEEPIPMKAAIAHSVNLCAAYSIMNLTTPEETAAFSAKLGLRGIPSLPSISLGSCEVSPLDMARAYSVFASEGYLSNSIAILKIELNGRPFYDYQPVRQQVLDSAVCYLITNAMESVIDSGTAAVVRQFYKGAAAGKTGTTQNYKDAWFIGYTPSITTAVWTGFDDQKLPLKSPYQYGGTAAAPIWAKMTFASAYKKCFRDNGFIIPSAIVMKQLCEETGLPTDISGNCIKSDLYPCDTTKVPVSPIK